jgi:hypothetical protein
MKCHRGDFEFIADCSALRKRFPCSRCELMVGPEAPLFMPSDTGGTSSGGATTGRCLVSEVSRQCPHHVTERPCHNGAVCARARVMCVGLCVVRSQAEGRSAPVRVHPTHSFRCHTHIRTTPGAWPPGPLDTTRHIQLAPTGFLLCVYFAFYFAFFWYYMTGMFQRKAKYCFCRPVCTAWDQNRYEEPVRVM